MRCINFLVHPQQHSLETATAYVTRLAELNLTTLSKLVKSAQPRLLNDSSLDTFLWNENLTLRNFDSNHLLLSIDAADRRPYRRICPICISENMPDVIAGGDRSLQEFCLFHGTKAIEKCHVCKAYFRYGSCSYSRCECGSNLLLEKTQRASESLFQLYLAVACNLPYGVTPLKEDFDNLRINEVQIRLRMTWYALYTGEPKPKSKMDGRYLDHFEFGMKWINGVELKLGSFFKYWDVCITSICCWTRHNLDHLLTEELLNEMLPWNHLRSKFKRNIGNCTGTNAPECELIGSACSVMRRGIKGDRLPWQITQRLILNRVISTPRQYHKYRDQRADPVGFVDSISIDEISQGSFEFKSAMIQLVALGAIQPLNLTHPEAWCFEREATKKFLIEIFEMRTFDQDKLLSKLNEKNYLTCLSFFVSKTTIGEFLLELMMDKETFVTELPEKNWFVEFVNIWPSNHGIRNRWAPHYLHHAVLNSLSRYAMTAARIAQNYLGFEKIISIKEIERYCGSNPSQNNHLQHQFETIEVRSLYLGLPRALVWSDGLLIDAGTEYEPARY